MNSLHEPILAALCHAPLSTSGRGGRDVHSKPPPLPPARALTTRSLPRQLLPSPHQGSDVFFQALEAASPSFRACPGHVLAAMSDLASVSGRSYSLFEYVGHPEAEAVVVMMGSGCQVAEDRVDSLEK